MVPFQLEWERRQVADPKQLFGKNLREIRKEKGWSQEQLAHEANLDRTYVGGAG